MKKTAMLIMIVSMCFIFTACRNTDFVNLSSFIDNYNAVNEAENKIDFSSFVVDENENKQIVSFFPDGTDIMAVRLENDEFNQIGEARIVLRKADKNADKIKLTEDDRNSFFNVCNKTAYAFSNGEITEIPAQIFLASVPDLFKESEITKETGDYYFIYYANSLVSVVIIRNNKLKHTETTNKPENKAPFAQMTETRSNTVPHK